MVKEFIEQQSGWLNWRTIVGGLIVTFLTSLGTLGWNLNNEVTEMRRDILYLAEAVQKGTQDRWTETEHERYAATIEQRLALLGLRIDRQDVRIDRVEDMKGAD